MRKEGLDLSQAAHLFRLVSGEVFYVSPDDIPPRFIRFIAASPENTITHEEISQEGELTQHANSRQGFQSSFLGAKFQRLGMMHDVEWNLFAAYLKFAEQHDLGLEELMKFYVFYGFMHRDREAKISA